MDRTERFYKIDQLLRDRETVSQKAFLEELGISAATFKRDIEYMRNRFNAPIVWDRKTRGYRFKHRTGEAAYELPGLWFNASEIHALLTMRQLLADLQPGLLEPHILPLLARLNALLGAGDHEWQEVEKRVRVFHVARRTVDLQHFEVVATALLRRRRLRIVHYNRSTDETSERTVSPQRLIHYRENWYLDTWCHLREAIRSFALDALRSASALNEPALDIPDEELDRELASGYGIFSGTEIRWAELRFTPERARWVSHEIWHPKQKSRFEPDGSYTLEVPYADDRELIMDILKHGPDVEVLAPESLRSKLQETIRAMAVRYR
jgi:predicted DNA-binding transcriptional regulator YafY